MGYISELSQRWVYSFKRFYMVRWERTYALFILLQLVRFTPPRDVTPPRVVQDDFKSVQTITLSTASSSSPSSSPRSTTQQYSPEGAASDVPPTMTSSTMLVLRSNWTPDELQHRLFSLSRTKVMGRIRNFEKENFNSVSQTLAAGNPRSELELVIEIMW